MSKELFEAFKIAKRELDAAEKKKQTDKLITLMNLAWEMDSRKLYYELKKKGLPKQIYVSAGVSQEVKTALSLFGPVCTHYLDEGITIRFSWLDVYKIEDTMPRLFLEPQKEIDR